MRSIVHPITMTNTPDTPAQLCDLIRSVEARITTHQQERQALVAQLRDIHRTAESLLLALVGHTEAPRLRGQPRTKDATGVAKRAVSAATRKKTAAAATKR